MIPLPLVLGVLLLGCVLLGLGVWLEARQQRGYASSDRPIEQLPRVRPGPGPGGRRPGVQDRSMPNLQGGKNDHGPDA